jgi:hypothetical protein
MYKCILLQRLQLADIFFCSLMHFATFCEDFCAADSYNVGATQSWDDGKT